ncbi:MAG TPA: hypothetical protein VGG01_19955 [Xanthobacteraceae bacterium]|jgi:hypothetical protein
MAHLVRRIAPALLASSVAALIVAAHAETPAASSTSDCLAKPNGPAAKGSHWYYRIQRPTGHHCWYQHATVDIPKAEKADAPRAEKDVPEHRHAAAPPPAPSAPLPAAAPVDPPVAEAPSAPAADVADNSNSVVPPVASPPAAARVNPPIDWPAPVVVPTVPATPAAQVDRGPVPSVETPPPAPEPKAEALQPQQLDTTPPSHQPARTSVAARSEEFAEPSNHVPALLGAVSALAIIIIGSFAGRILTKRPPRRTQAKARPRHWQAAESGMEEDAPGIVPVMPNGRDVAHERPDQGVEALASPDDWGLRRGRAPRRVIPPNAAAMRPSRESTRVLEENVRELLHRLQSDLSGRPAEPEPVAPAAASIPAKAPHVPSSQELDAVLAIWRAKRSG